MLNQNSTVSLTDDKNSCYYGLNNDKGFGWVLNSNAHNLYEITLKSYYYIITGSSTHQISSSEKIRVASCKLIEVKYPNVFFAADSVIEINPSFGVSKSAKQTFDMESKYLGDMLVVPIHHLTSVCLSVHNSEFTDDHTNFAKLTSILEEYNPFVYWNLRLMWQISCYSSEKFTNIHEIGGPCLSKAFTEYLSPDISKTLVAIDGCFGRIEHDEFVPIFENWINLRSIKLNIYIEGKRSVQSPLFISQSSENNDALLLDWISKWTKLESLAVIINHFSSVQDPSGIKEELKKIMYSNPFLRSVIYTSTWSFKKSGSRIVNFETPHWYQFAKISL